MSDPRKPRLDSEARTSDTRPIGRVTSLRMPRRGGAEPITAGYAEDLRPSDQSAHADRRWSRTRRAKPLGAPGGQVWPELTVAPVDLVDQVAGPRPDDPGSLSPPVVARTTSAEGPDDIEADPARLVPPAQPPTTDWSTAGSGEGCNAESTFLARFAPRDPDPV